MALTATTIKMATDVQIPRLGADMVEAIIGRWLKQEGDEVEKGDALVEVETAKATFELEAEDSGTLLKTYAKEGDSYPIGKTIAVIGKPGEKVKEVSKDTKPGSRVKASPAAKRLAKDHNIDLQVAFSGATHLIKEKDIEEYLSTAMTNVTSEEITPKKKEEIRALSKSKEYIQSSVTISVSATAIQEKIKTLSSKHKIQLGLGEYISYEAAKLLKTFPDLNAFFQNDKINHYKEVNLGMAVKPEGNLVVPIIQKADSLSLEDFTKQSKDLILKSIKDNLDLSDVQNGTFTVTDLSAYGVLNFAPVINRDQAAILGISAPYDSCTEENGTLKYTQNLNLTLVFDHRVADGKYALDFLNELKKKLES